MSERSADRIRKQQQKILEEAKKKYIEGIKNLPDDPIGYFNNAGAVRRYKKLDDQFREAVRQIQELEKQISDTDETVD